ncbi:MAG: glycosyltransferase family 4 protein, partial [Nonlabens sp.]|nr:glycosyltransferase family 4 protein [Nonlabens sp.]
MHIAYLTPEYPHERVLHSAGIGTSIKNLATALIENGHEVTLFVYGQQESDVFKEDGITFHLIAQKKYPIGGFYFYRKHIARYINKYSKGIDILEAADWTGITAFCDFRVPHVIRLHGSDTYFCHLEGRPQKKKNFLFEKWALQNADAVVSVSSFTAQKTTQLFDLRREIQVVHNMIDLEFFKPLHEPQSETVILNFGSLVRKKGVIALAKAFEKLSETNNQVQLLFLGNDVRDAQTGAMTSELIKQELSANTLSRVQFKSHVPYDQVKHYIQQATVVCLPSYAEAFPMTWLEAMALEKPLVTSNLGWADEVMISEQTGITAHPDDSTSIVVALQRL